MMNELKLKLCFLNEMTQPPRKRQRVMENDRDDEKSKPVSLIRKKMQANKKEEMEDHHKQNVEFLFFYRF